MKHFFPGLVYVLAVQMLIGAPQTSITKDGITWQFDQAYEAGQYANGDWWVVGPVTVSSITPGWDGAKNGSMVNPIPSRKQAYDKDMGDSYPYLTFDQTALVTAPVTLQPNASLVSTESQASNRINRAAVLTVVDSIPPDSGTTVFRPAYAGTTKVLYSTDDLQTDLLAGYSRLPVISQTPDPASFLTTRSGHGNFGTLWLDHIAWVSGVGGDYTQYFSPRENMPTYGREYSYEIGKVALLLLTDQQELINRFGTGKDEVLIHMVQKGIDLYHVALSGGYWWPGGGLNHGRKWPILFAGLMLDHSGMRNISTYQVSMPFGGGSRKTVIRFMWVRTKWTVPGGTRPRTSACPTGVTGGTGKTPTMILKCGAATDTGTAAMPAPGPALPWPLI